MLDKFFDFIFNMPIIRKFRPFYEKRKDIVLYIFFGGLTTVVAFFTFWLAEVNLKSVNYHEIISNIISWIFAVAFAFFTNRVWVFNAPTKTVSEFLNQMLLFYSGRIFSLLVETAIIWGFATRLGFNSLIVKLVATIIVLILNYIISKLFVFKKEANLNIEGENCD